MFARFTLSKINIAASRLSSWVSNSITTRWLSKSAIPMLRRSKRALLVVLLLASSAAALTSLGVWRAVRSASSLAHGATSASRVNVASPATTDPPFTKLKEYVYAGGRLVTSEEISCVPTLSSAPSPQGGGPGSFDFSLPSICSWTATSNVGWITMTSGSSGSGNGTVSYSVAANSGPQRVGTITVNGQAFTITQAPNPASCGFSLNKTNDTFPQEGGSRPLALTAGAGCAWNAVSNDASWLTASPASGVGSATINYSATANSGQQRVSSISIKVGGQTFATLTVTQLPNQASCTFAFSPGSRLVGVGGENGVVFNVTTGAGCIWNAENTNGWIIITGGATNNTGSGTVTFNVEANNGGSRTGAISVRGQSFTVTQCGYVVSPTSASFNGGGGTGSITVSAAAGCAWSATSDAEWITITSGTSGAGNGSVNYRVDGISDACSFGRAGHITVAGRTVLIGQSNIVQPCIINPACCEGSAMGAESRGLTARYFNNTTLSGQPTLERIDPVINFDWAGASPDKLLAANEFSARWNAQLAAPSSEPYTFFIYSDGGVRLWVNNRLVVDRWQPPFEAVTQSAPVDLKAETRAEVRVEYYNAGQGGVIYLLWSSATTPRQIIPRRYLHPEAATNESTPADTNKQTGMLLPPGSDACPKARRPEPGAAIRWQASPLGRGGLVLLIGCGVLALLLLVNWRQARGQLAMVAGVAPRLRDQIASRLGELLQIAEAVFDKLKIVAGFIKRLLAGSYYKLNVARLGKRLSAGICDELLPERMQAIARRSLSWRRNLGLGRLKPALRRAMAIALVVRLAAPLTPVEADGLIRAAQTTWRAMSAYTNAAANLYSAGSGSGLLNHAIEMALGRPAGKVVSAAPQAEEVTHLQVCPSQHVMFVGERYTFTPVALDSSNKVVHGASMSWSSLTLAVATVSSFGQVEAVAVGNTTVTVQSGSVSTDIQIEVRGGTRPTGSNQQADLDTGDCSGEQASMYAPQSAAASAQQGLIGNDGVPYDWDPLPQANSQATHFRNAVGNPRFTAVSQASAAVPTRTQLGSYSYQFNVPVISVGGRGASANIAMTFNSRVWNADNGKLTFNYVGAYPSPGWTVGFGKIIRNYNATATGDQSGIGSGNSPGDYLLVTGDGTRIRLAAKYEPQVGRWLHESDDGSFLKFDSRSGQMRHPDGSRMVYSSVNGCLLPTAMIGTNGGAITMTYRDYCEGSCQRVFRHRTALSAVRDTLGRYVTFHYYGDVGNEYPVDAAQGRPAGELAAIKAPDKDGVQQEVIRAHYRAITLKYNFGGLAVDAPANNSQIQVLSRVYYPQTGRGVLFLDYSSYGMPRKISTRMAIKGAGGTITEGVEIAYTTYNYTTIVDPGESDPYDRNQVGSLNDFPQFTRREEWWLGKTNSSGEPTTDPTRYDYSRVTVGTTEEMTMKYVDKNCEEVTTTGNDSGQLNFGKVISVERKKSDPVEVLSKQVFTYTTGPDGEVEIEKIEAFDEAEQGTLVSFGYGRYGRVTDQYEYGYKQGGVYQVRRRVHSDFVDVQSYLDERFLYLVSRVIVYDAAGAPKVETRTTYDDYDAMGGIEFHGLTASEYPPNHDDKYDQSKVMRGNVTAIMTFSNIASGEATTRQVNYDIFGNVVEAELSCCVKKFFGFSVLTAYSQPDSVRSGGDTGLSLETTYQYNNFTGLLRNETNPDGQQTDYEYDSALRLIRVTAPTGAVTETHFDQDGNGNDQLTYFSQTIYDDQGTERRITGKRWFDGAGRVIRAGTGVGSAPDNYDMTATIYDRWGRVLKQSNPYAGDANGKPQEGVTQYWTVTTYDELSRVKKVTLPDSDLLSDPHFFQMEYKGATATSGATVVTTDTVGRKREIEVDGLGRLVKVKEQNPANGNLEWVTSHSYDVLDNLIQTNQGGQLRTFEYDDRSRLISETTPEAGQITYEYTDFDAVSRRRDARGVITTYTYGELNLLTDVSYDRSQAPGVAPTAAVSISYKEDSPGKGQVDSVTDGTGGDGESYTYDSFGRLQSCTRVIDGINYPKQYEYNEANQMTLMIYPSGKRVNVGRDDRGRLSALKSVDASGAPLNTYLSGINYRVDGQVSGQNLGDETTESFEYSDDRLQLILQKVMKGGAMLLNLSYGYGALDGQMGNGSKAGNSGQPTSVTGTINGQGRNQAFTYDNVSRLVKATASGDWAWARRFDYDRYGNRTAVWDAVSGGNKLQNTVIGQANGMTTNRIESVNGTSFSYDAGGNVTGDGVKTYTYDAEKRLVSVSPPVSESYGYDASNHRVKKVVGGVVTHYIWEGDQVIAEYERGGGSTSATGTRYYHQDRLSPRFITNSSGVVVGTTDHLPFGEEIGGIGEQGKYNFTTYEKDNTGLHYAVNRYYDPRQGRFNQADPLGMGAASLADPQSLNLYSYVQNDPINFRDPTGLYVCCAEFDNGAGYGGSDVTRLGGGGGGAGGGKTRIEDVIYTGKRGIMCSAEFSFTDCGGMSGILNGSFGNSVAENNREYGGLAPAVADALREHNERLKNARDKKGYQTDEELGKPPKNRPYLRKPTVPTQVPMPPPKPEPTPRLPATLPKPLRNPQPFPPTPVPKPRVPTPLPKLILNPLQEWDDGAMRAIHAFAFGESVNGVPLVGLRTFEK
jgi:RHS repeat-associated protein